MMKGSSIATVCIFLSLFALMHECHGQIPGSYKSCLEFCASQFVACTESLDRLDECLKEYRECQARCVPDPTPKPEDDEKYFLWK